MAFLFLFSIVLHLSISNGYTSYKFYKGHYFDFDIVLFPLLDGFVTRGTSYE